MKARILALLAMVLGVVSCQTEPEGLDVNVGGEGVTTISVVLPEDAISRATAAGETNSAWSGLQNTAGETLRVILQVFDENGNTNASETLRQEQVLQEGVLTAYFDVRLVPNRKYTFVAWADQGADYFDATDLKDVKIVEGSWTAMNEYRDAFTATHTEASFSSASNITLNLTRPFAKLRVVTTDMAQLGHLDIDPVKAAVAYNVELPNSFNAFAGTIGTTTETKSFTFDIAEYNQDAAGTKTLFTDYVFVPADGVVKFNLDTKEADDRRIKLNQFNTDIPVKRNNLTTIQGNILTEGNNVTVTVEDAFENVENGTTTYPDYDYATISSEKEFMDAIKGTGGNYILISNLNLTGVYAQAAAATRTTTGPKTVNINLNGLTINVNNQTGNALVTLNDGDTLIFSGEGSIVAENGSKELVDGGNVYVTGTAEVDAKVAVDENGKSVVKSGLDALVYICENGGEFTFTENFEIANPLAVSTTKPVVINGNGKTITYTGSARAFNVNGLETANVTLNDLTFVNSESYSERCINFNVAGKLTLNNVTVGATGTPATYAINLPGSSDGAEVVINNSNIRGNIALNIWGEKAVVNATNTIFSNYDSTEVEDYTTIVLNNDGSTVAEGAVVNIIGGKVIGKNEKDEPLHAVNNGTVTGVVNISETTEVIGAIKETVAIVDYNSTSFYSFTTIQGAINKVCKDKNGFVRLVKDITVDETITIPADGNVTINLNGKTITGTDSATSSFGLITNNGNLTITGNGKMTLKAENNRGWNAYSSVISNTVGGNLTVMEGVVIEHLGGTDMAYGIDNLTNGKGTYAVTTIDGATVKSTYSAIRQFLNGVEATNELYVKAGSTLVSPNRSIFFQDPSKNANTGKLVVEAGASVTGDVRLSVTEGSKEWPVKVSVAASALVNGSEVTYGYIPAGYNVELEDDAWTVVAYKTEVAEGLYQNGVKYLVMNAEGLATLNTMMANKTAGKNVVVKLAADIDFTGKTWTPVDSHADSAFWLKEIDGQGHTISNLTIDGQAMFTRFAGVDDVTIKDITFDNANVNSNGSINTSILTVQSYQNVLLDNVDVKNSTIIGGYKVAPLIATVYNESPSTITATLKNCDVYNVTVKATVYDFCTTGMVAFVYEGNNDRIVFENCTVKDVKLMAKPNGYAAHAAIYVNDKDTDDLINEAEGVTVENVTFEAL